MDGRDTIPDSENLCLIRKIRRNTTVSIQRIMMILIALLTHCTMTLLKDNKNSVETVDSKLSEFQGNEAELQKRQSASMEKINVSMIRHVRQVGDEIGANAVLVYVDVIKSRAILKTLLQESHCILAAMEKHVLDELKTLEGNDDRIIQVPCI